MWRNSPRVLSHSLFELPVVHGPPAAQGEVQVGGREAAQEHQFLSEWEQWELTVGTVGTVVSL